MILPPKDCDRCGLCKGRNNIVLPTGNLDSVTGRGILDLLAGLEGVSLVMVTHSAEAAGTCSRILTLAQGRLI